MNQKAEIVSLDEDNDPMPMLPAAHTVISAEIDVQIATAKRYPRSVSKFMQRLNADVTISAEVADACYYALSRKDKDGDTVEIFGPSIRFAEIVLTRWGNCRAAARIVDTTEHFVIAQGAFLDLESNASVAKETVRRITTNKGKRYGDDMIAMTSNAAASIALRNAILAGIPQAYWKPAYMAAVDTIIGKAATFGEKRKALLEWFAGKGVGKEQVLAAVGVAGIADLGADQILKLVGWKTSIEEGHPIENFFPPANGKAPPTGTPPKQANQNPGGATQQDASASSTASSAADGDKPTPPTTGKSTVSAPPGPQSPPPPAAYTFASKEAALEWAAEHRAHLEAAKRPADIRALQQSTEAQRAALHLIDEDASMRISSLAFELGESLTQEQSR